jgi:cyclopropane-fatty-acyl-phospholipid synthase
MWEYYLAYCEAGFRAGTIDVGLYRIEKPLSNQN